MYLSELKLWNFRKYATDGADFASSKPGITVNFNDGVNVLIGENDSGKTAIVDAIRYILKTHSLEYIPIDEKDFHKPAGEGRRSELRIECAFRGISDPDAAHFLEWIGFDKDKQYELKVWLYAKIQDNQIHHIIRAGVDQEGNYIEGTAKDLLRIIYLKPLRDALTEMTNGNKSRLAQILKSLDEFRRAKQPDGTFNKHQLEDHFDELKETIDGYFGDSGGGSGIRQTINQILQDEFFLDDDSREATLSLVESELSEILKQLNLILESNKSGLGSLNLLFMAAELLHLKSRKAGLKLTIIEELEAHLHPQYQLRLIDFVQNNKENYGQFILTSHSTTLASKISLENIILCQGGRIFPMGKEHTMLEEGDYQFLERFLDATKANLFFAKGVILVEGDAENLLIPTLAELMDRPLNKYGVSIVNVGSTAFNRYSKIFQRNNTASAADYLDIPVALITDLDVRSIEYYNSLPPTEVKTFLEINSTNIVQLKAVGDYYDYDRLLNLKFSSISNFFVRAKEHKKSGRISKVHKENITTILKASSTAITPQIISDIRTNTKEKKTENLSSQKVKAFVSPNWTLEYEIAMSPMCKYLKTAIECAKIIEADNTALIDTSTLSDLKAETELYFTASTLPVAELAFEVFTPLLNGNVSKAIVAQYMAQIIKGDPDAKEAILTDPNLAYLKDAIIYVTKEEIPAATVPITEATTEASGSTPEVIEDGGRNE